MKLLLLSQNSGTWRAEERPEWRRFQSGFEAWTFCPGVEATYCNGNLATLDLVNAHDIVMAGPGDILDESLDVLPALLKLQAARNPNVKWVTMMDDVRDFANPAEDVLSLLDNSDLVNVLNGNTLEFFRGITEARSEYIGIPYPAKEIRELFTDGPRDEIFIKQALWGRHSSIPSLLACEGNVDVSTIGTDIDHVDLCQYNADVAVHQEAGQQEYLKSLSATAFAFVNLEERYTWGRNVLDCAALGIPCITTRATYHGSIFFPQLVVADEFCIGEAKALLRRLREDAGFYCRMTDVSLSLFDEYTHEVMLAKLLKGLA